MRSTHSLLVSLLAVTSVAAAEQATVTGKITDQSGSPVSDATVMIYRAGVKTGYSTYCPTCYIDCGKRTKTDLSGSYTIRNVSSDLWFDVVVVREGYAPAIIKRVDPSRGPAPVTNLKGREPIAEPARVVRGRLVDGQGDSVSGALVEPLGISIGGENGSGEISRYGLTPGLEPFAVSNEKGEFELAHQSNVNGMLLRVEPRGMAPKLIALDAGHEPKTVELRDGAVVRGRLIDQGKPVAGAQVGLIARERGGFGGKLAIVGHPYGEMRVGTQPDGSFVIANVPTGVDWYVYAKMDSIAKRGATIPVECSTRQDGEVVDVGNLQVERGHRLRGRYLAP